MVDKGRLLKIANLNVAGEIEKMDDTQLSEYVQSLNSFIEKFPALEEKFKTDFGTRDYELIFEGLISVCDLLRKIRADVLAEEGLNQINQIRNNEEGISEAGITGFFAAVSALSIDIQMAMFSTQTKEKDPPPKKKEDGPGRKITSILAVDDVTFFLGTLQTLLKDTGYKLTCVSTGAAALRFLRENSPDLFLLDIEMPEMNGYELAKKIRENGHKAPIIFLTANSSHKHVMKAIEAGAADFIVKPINKTQVTSKIEKVLKAGKSM